MEMWNSKLTRENIVEFYNATIDMVFPSVFEICKEGTRTEQAIVKSYVDTYQQRQFIKGDDVLMVFGDILFKNANEIIEKYELPENLYFAKRDLDEYTRNSMLEKIKIKIDSRTFKVAEFISSDAKKARDNKTIRMSSFTLPISPLLVFQLIILALIIWGVSYAAVTLPYRNNQLIDSSSRNEQVELQDKYQVNLDNFPLRQLDTTPTETIPETSVEEIAPSIQTQDTSPVATMG